MNTGKKYSKMLFLVALLVAFVAGCGSDNNDAAPLSSAKAITAFVLNGATGVIDETEKTIEVNLPNGTSKVGLIATFSTTGASVMVGTTLQTSGVGPANDFSGTVLYTVIAADGTSVNYAVTVTVGLPTSNSILAYSLADQVSSSITGTAIAVTMPFGTNKVGLIATFSHSGASVMVVSTTQVSGVTPNNFTSPVTYTVTAANSDIKTYMVTVTNALNPAKIISAYTITGQSSSSIIGTAITVTMPFSTPSVTSLVATFTASPDAVVTVGGVTQVSGTTANDFANSVDYLVTAASGTTATYTVTVNLAAAPPPSGPVVCTGAPNCVNLGTAANYVIFGNAGVTNVPTSATTGNVGTAAAASTITGFALVADSTNVFSTSTQVAGKVYAVDYASPTPADVGTASTDMGNAYTAANNITGGAACPGSGNFGGLSLAPGIYKCTTGVTIPTDVTLAGTGAATDVWVFQIAGTLTQSSAAKVLLTNGALPQNVFWTVAGSVSIGTTAQMKGVILGQTDINVLNGATVNGRLLAQTLVNLAGGTNTVVEPQP